MYIHKIRDTEDNSIPDHGSFHQTSLFLNYGHVENDWEHINILIKE